MILQDPESNATAARTLVSGMMLGWDERRTMPDITIRQSLGQAGELEVETKVGQKFRQHSAPQICIAGRLLL